MPCVLFVLPSPGAEFQCTLGCSGLCCVRKAKQIHEFRIVGAGDRPWLFTASEISSSPIATMYTKTGVQAPSPNFGGAWPGCLAVHLEWYGGVVAGSHLSYDV